MEIQKILVEGSSKKVYSTSQSDQVVIKFEDTFAAKGDGKKESLPQKGEMNNEISAFLFEYLESYNVPTHFVRNYDSRSFVARKLDMIPIEISVYNAASGDLAKRLAIEEGRLLEFPVVEMYLKKNDGEWTMINEYHAYALGLCDRKEMTSVTRIATKVNAVLKSFFDRRKLKLVEFSLEFGRHQNQILVGDEMSLDSIRLGSVNDDGGFDPLAYHTRKDGKMFAQLKETIAGNQA